METDLKEVEMGNELEVYDNDTQIAEVQLDKCELKDLG